MHRAQRADAGLVTAPALLGADPAVLMVPGVLLAFLGTQLAGQRTQLERVAQHAHICS